MQTPAGRDRVLPLTRVLAAVIVPVLLAAFVILSWDPTRNGDRFSWPVAPPMTALMLGATYLGGAWFFLHVALHSAGWHRFRLGFIPVTVFAAIMGIATILHWDRFTHGSAAFVLWASLYLSLPVVIPAVWLANERAAAAHPLEAGGLLGRGERTAYLLLGALLMVAAGLLLVVPSILIGIWPWALSPLTARAMAAMFALSGMVGLAIGRDGRLAPAAIILQAQVVAIGLMLVGLLRSAADLAWDSPGIWLFATAMLAALLLAGWTLLRPRRA